MPHKARIHSSRRYCFLPLAFLFFLLIPARAAQLSSSSSPSLESTAQSGAGSALPAEWSAGVKALVEKIAVAVKPARTVSLEVKNISSLGAPEVESVRNAFAAEVKTQGLRIGPGGANVEVTLSENVDGYLWVAATHRQEIKESAPGIAIVSVAKATLDSKSDDSASIVLSKRLVWEQPTEFLDFLIVERPTTVMASSLMVLEPDRLVYYRSTTPQWQLWQAIPFPRIGLRSRTSQGRISTEFHRVWGPGGECSGDLADPTTMKCSPQITILAGAHVVVKIPGYEAYQNELLSERCGDKSVALVSGSGDWMEPDSLQGYLFSDVVHPDAVPSGGPIEFEGPVKSMQVDDRESVRVIVRNLKTGNYEGYIVTATCNH